jgi:uroporphyrinogen decarboxylase
VEDISTTYTNVALRNLDACMATGIQPDGLWIYGDMAYNHATMCSPKMYRDILWNCHKRMADWAHAHGMKFIFHTDGDINAVMDLYIAAGFDAIQPLECKAGMDVRNLLPKYADRLCFFGNIDVMKMIPNDLALIEEEIVSKFAIAKKTRGYMYHSDHSVPPQVSWKTYQAIIEMIKKHGNYR